MCTYHVGQSGGKLVGDKINSQLTGGYMTVANITKPNQFWLNYKF